MQDWYEHRVDYHSQLGQIESQPCYNNIKCASWPVLPAPHGDDGHTYIFVKITHFTCVS